MSPFGAALMLATKNQGIDAIRIQIVENCALSCALRPSMPVPVMRHANVRKPSTKKATDSASFGQRNLEDREQASRPAR